MNLFPLADQTVLVTGAGGGIGSAVALELARRGASLVLHTGHHTSALDAVRQKVARMIENNRAWCQTHHCPVTSQKIWTHQVDFSISRENENHLDVFCAQVWLETGGVQSVIACAGGDILTNGAAQWTFEQRLESLITVDLRATTRMVRWFGQRMRTAAIRSIESVTLAESETESGAEMAMDKTNAIDEITTDFADRNGPPSVAVTGIQPLISSIVLIGWSGVERGLAGEGGELFGAVKGAIHGFGRSLALSLAPEVRVNVIAPGWIRTAWGQQASPVWQRQVLNETALRRWGTPENIATTAAFLISPDAAFLTGCILPVDGGFTSRPEFFGENRKD